MASPFLELEVDTPSGERTVKVTNPDKTYFSGLPEGKGRKLDLVEYYLAVGDGIVRGLRERPTVLKRHPGGAETEAIYQKRVPDNRPPWLETVTVTFPSGRNATELCPVDVAHVAWAANLGCLDFHPWPTRRDHVEHPDELRIDLDPMPGTGWAEVLETAPRCSALFDELGLRVVPEDERQQGRPRLPAHRAVLDLHRGAARRGRRRARGRAAASRPRDRAAGGRRSAASGCSSTSTGWRATRRSRRRTACAPAARRPCRRPSRGTSCPTARSPTSTSGRCASASPGSATSTPPSTTCTTTSTPLLELYERQGEGEAPFPPQFAKQEGEPLRSRPSVREPAAAKRAAAAERRRKQGDEA